MPAEQQPTPAPVKETKELQNFAIPGAIVLAGILISGAIIFTQDGASGSGTGTQSASTLAGLAKAAGVKEKDFLACVKEDRHAAKVDTVFTKGIEAGVQGTPTTFIVHQSGRIERIGGADQFANVKTLIDAVLADPTPKEGQEDLSAILAINNNDHVEGDSNAVIKMIEYSDYECPFCKSFHPTMTQVMKEYGAKGQVAWVYRHFPLDAIHPQARPLAEASECAAELGGNEAFWKFTHKVMSTSGKFDLSVE